MKAEFLDYSPDYYVKDLGRTTPKIRSGKFVQIRNAGTEYIVFSPRELSAYHANIAERFFLSRGIEGSYNSKRDHYTVRDPGWHIAGGGVWEIDEGASKLLLGGTSQAYGDFDPSGLALRLQSTRDLSGFSISVYGPGRP